MPKGGFWSLFCCPQEGPWILSPTYSLPRKTFPVKPSHILKGTFFCLPFCLIAWFACLLFVSPLSPPCQRASAHLLSFFGQGQGASSRKTVKCPPLFLWHVLTMYVGNTSCVCVTPIQTLRYLTSPDVNPSGNLDTDR